MDKDFVIGVDFGSDSVRALIKDCSSGAVASQFEYSYERWSKGLYQDARKSMFRQHPADYLEALEAVVCGAIDRAGKNAQDRILAIGVDTTGSTPCPVNEEGVPLSLTPAHEENPNAMFHLWKDHTASVEAERINSVLQNFEGINYNRYQGAYCSEWWWAKILHTILQDESIRRDAFSWVEHCDWITGLLAGNTDPLTMYRCACGAGHKALWHSDWGGLPSSEALASLHPYLAKVKEHYGVNVAPAGACVGNLSAEYQEKFGLPASVIVGGCSFDAHAGAVGGGVNAGRMVSSVGTSTVNMIVEKAQKLVGKNIGHACGMAENSVLPGYIGIENGQAAFGDIYAWLKRCALWSVDHLVMPSETISQAQKHSLTREVETNFFKVLAEKTQESNIADLPVFLDWFNGRRYPHTDDFAKSAACGLHLGVTMPDLYLSLIYATAFGMRRIVDELLSAGISIQEIVLVGGIANKSPLVVQTLSNVLNQTISVSETTQGGALGAAIFAAVAGGAFNDFSDAQKKLCEPCSQRYFPEPQKHTEVEAMYKQYLKLSQKFS